MTRRHGDPPRAGQVYSRRPGVYAILLRSGGLLTTFQSRPLPEFQLPGGGIDPGEHPIGALHREVLEETGWRVQILRRVGAFRRFTFMPEYDLWAEKVCSVYLARPVLCLGPPREPGHSAVWLPVPEALDLLGNPGDRAMLGQVTR